MLVHGDERVATLGDTFPHAGEIADMTHYTGYVVAPGTDSFVFTFTDPDGSVVATITVVFEIAEDALDTARQEIVTIMESAAELSVPLAVDVGVGDNWDEAH